MKKWDAVEEIKRKEIIKEYIEETKYKENTLQIFIIYFSCFVMIGMAVYIIYKIINQNADVLFLPIMYSITLIVVSLFILIYIKGRQNKEENERATDFKNWLKTNKKIAKE